jgi:hypothetical protein
VNLKIQTAIAVMSVILLSACGDKATKEQHPKSGISEVNLSGVWNMHRGKAIDELTIEDKGGVLTGTVKDDAAWGGHEHPIHGLRVGQNVEWSYEADSTGSISLFTMKGTINSDSMSGSFHLVSQISGDALWIATRK